MLITAPHETAAGLLPNINHCRSIPSQLRVQFVSGDGRRRRSEDSASRNLVLNEKTLALFGEVSDPVFAPPASANGMLTHL
jgi:hypothetical protein